MLFKRKKSRPLWSKVRNWLWPDMGWMRFFKYIKYRLIRLPASDSSIALGLSLGVAVSWTPTFGFHILQCFVLCLFLPINFFASVIGTLFGNPWTFPALMWISYQVGYWVLELLGYGNFIHNGAEPIMLYDIKDSPLKIFVPTLIGGYIMALITIPLAYFPFYFMVKGGRAAQDKIKTKLLNKIRNAKKKK
ncbi:MAG: DUF2062 domain-containing protein [Alphaproteobacteria bacterium]|nr:DUF2062 domain-containing protein [Alphaproteobacteria bacterium]